MAYVSGARGRGRGILKDNMERLHSVEVKTLRRPGQKLVDKIQLGERGSETKSGCSNTSSGVLSNNASLCESNSVSSSEGSDTKGTERLVPSKGNLLRKPNEKVLDKVLHPKMSDKCSIKSSNDERSSSGSDRQVSSQVAALNPDAAEFVPGQTYVGPDIKCIIPIIDPKTMRPIDLGNSDVTSKAPGDWTMDYDDDEFEFKIDRVIEAVSSSTIQCQPLGDIKYQREVQDLLDMIHQQLSRNPGLYLKIMKAMEKILHRWCGFSDTLQFLSKKLVEQGMAKSYAYLAARMCAEVNKMTVSLGMKPAFRSYLLNVCEEKNAQLEEVLEKGDYLSAHGIITFFAELFVQLTFKDETRIINLGVAVMEGLDKLIGNPNESNVGCVCKILKLCGWALDTDCKGQMGELLNKLHTVSLSKKFDDLTLGMIKGVKALADRRWDRGSPVGSISDPPASPTKNFTNGDRKVNGVNDPADNKLSEEEFKFFNDNLKMTLDDLGFSAYDSDLENEVSDDMDEEACEAYEEFLSSIPNKNKKIS